jgi:TPR repeat protein
LLIDLTDAERSELEAAKLNGMVVVSYDCHSLRILHDCHLDGGYTFVSVTPKQRSLHLEDADELLANAVLSPASKLEGTLRRGQALDVNWIQTGLLESARGAVTRDELHGPCAGATHIIGRVAVGAFAVKTATNATVLAGGNVISVGANANSTSERNEHYEDGNVEVCNSASQTTETTARFCQALVQADLLAIDEPPTPGILTESSGQLGRPVTATRIALVPTCPLGYVAHGGSCHRETPGKLRHCTPTELVDCTAQCDGGDADSCEYLARILLDKPTRESTTVHALSLRRRGCELGSGLSCLGLAGMLERGEAITQSPEQARHLYASACSSGLFSACTSLGLLDYRQLGHKNITDESRSQIELTFERACIGGDALGCFHLGAINGYLTSKPDPIKAKDGYARACRIGFGLGCTNWAAVLVAENTTASGELNPVTLETASEILVYGCRLGERTACLFGACLASSRNWERAWDFLDEGCEAGYIDCCGDAGRLLTQRGDAKQRPLAKAYLDRACNGHDVSSCMQLAESTDGNPLSPTESIKRLSLLDKSCQNDAFGSACLRLGELYEHGDFGPVDPIRAVTYFSESCQRNNDQGCRQLARAYETGEGVPRDANRAVEILSQRCNLRVKEGPSCSDLGRILLEGLGGTERITEGLAALQFACERNQAQACTMLGNHLLSHTTPNKRAEAELHYKKGCTLGDRNACHRLRELTGQPASPKEPRIELGSAITGCLDREIEVLFE